MALPINITKLLESNLIEKERLELKEGFITDNDRVQFITKISIHPDFINDQKALQTGGLNQEKTPLDELYGLIGANPGIKAKNISDRLNRPLDTVYKQIIKLVKEGLVERKGSKKTGGYYIK